ncbi:MAG: rRNA pseudouridine synthase [Desulfobulbaceae bacterium]|nr:rRNA pseudouridine synthase [Desulfobulbaceae bacterium]
MNNPIRLQKFIAQCGIASRRKAEELISKGRIAIDGVKVTEMGIRVIPGKNKITFDGKPVEAREQLVYYLLNKPKGYVTTLSDPQGRPIVTSLIKDSEARLFPVGRLDLDTEGALILTNDGEFAQKIQHPSHGIDKTYQALVKGCPQKDKIALLERGILLEAKMTSPATVSVVSKTGKNCLMQITIHEGRKRQVKKMFDFIGHPVLHLKRTAYGKLSLGRIALGDFRQLNPSELNKIFL